MIILLTEIGLVTYLSYCLQAVHNGPFSYLADTGVKH